MSIDRMLTEEEPVAELVGRVLQEAGIEFVFGISGGQTGRVPTVLDVRTSLKQSFADITSPLAVEASPRWR